MTALRAIRCQLCGKMEENSAVRTAAWLHLGIPVLMSDGSVDVCPDCLHRPVSDLKAAL